jgi:hypothetical protein
MLTVSPLRARAIRGCFWAAGIGFGSMGVIWGVWGADLMQSIAMRMSVAGITAAVAAVALTWALWQIQDHTIPTARDAGGPGGPGGHARVSGNYSGGQGGAGGEGGLGRVDLVAVSMSAGIIHSHVVAMVVTLHKLTVEAESAPSVRENE